MLVQAFVKNVTMDPEHAWHSCPSSLEVFSDLPVLRKPSEHRWNVVGCRRWLPVASQLHTFHWTLYCLSIYKVWSMHLIGKFSCISSPSEPYTPPTWSLRLPNFSGHFWGQTCPPGGRHICENDDDDQDLVEVGRLMLILRCWLCWCWAKTCPPPTKDEQPASCCSQKKEEHPTFWNCIISL